MATLPVLPLTDAVLLPGMVIPVTLDPTTQAAIDAARATGDRKLLAVPRIDGEYGPVGVVATIEKVGRLPEGEPAAVIRGLSRARIGSGVPGPGAALWVEATELDEPAHAGRARELAREYRALVTSVLQQRGAWQVIDAVERMTDLSELADSAGYAPWLTLEQKTELLAAPDVTARLELLVGWVKDYLAEQEVTEQINSDVREGLEKSQREFLLRQQLAAIRKELGEDEPDGSADYRSRVESAELPEKVREAAMREVGKLERASDASPEAGWIRTWLDTVLEMPWGTRTEDNTDLAAARAVLDADHAGLSDVKDRILEYLAVRNRRAERNLGVVGGRGSGAVLALAGPPGVGKTSLGESVARALGRNFVRVSLGGVRDEAEIRGHRRTYVGALPGRIVRALREAGSMNPVVLLDEVDKLAAGYAGDPAAALLEVLDPAQNHTFRDHYLEVDLDLSDVLFLATANVVESIPGPLLDRMELVTLDGYTEDEKVAIARDHLLPRQRERAGLTVDEVSVADEALALIAGEYTREAGVRQLERALAKILRKVAVTLATDPTPARVGTDNLTGYLGRPKFTPESAERTAVPGVATGLAVTGAGGDVLFIEATSMEGEPGLTLTGQLGDVMKESAQIALSYLRSNGRRFGIDPNALAGRRIHVHFPAGAVPKDGPSAGITMVTALASLVTGRPVRPEFGMTGEVTLSGRVLPIGGVKQKLLAAHRAGLTEVIIPARNEPDLDDLPTEVREALTVHTLADVADVLALALRPADVKTLDGPALFAV
ncbi:endopeptidase La [Micromonospora sp. NPDC053740]|uniref:endopeptidase La n=1 Tax=Micromonospora TaxID=1873 RepID=UPI001EE90156|nr:MULTISPECIES: endopeptidase La [Micromonospora]MCG5451388.1 endopeptidase La [Micromonospora hortensis]MCG5466430.1 endopeptidase La [Micromonospora alfalfae]MCX5116599.1 endopeptidase La [Micromonospora sp. NBC_00362]WTI05143.1 endopeptidase La [Micromonospora sp. NBC_00821]